MSGVTGDQPTTDTLERVDALLDSLRKATDARELWQRANEGGTDHLSTTHFHVARALARLRQDTSADGVADARGVVGIGYAAGYPGPALGNVPEPGGLPAAVSAVGTELRDALRHVDECFENDGSYVIEMVREAKRIADAWAIRNEDARHVSALLAGILPPLCDAAGVVRAALAADADTPKADLIEFYKTRMEALAAHISANPAGPSAAQVLASVSSGADTTETGDE